MKFFQERCPIPDILYTSARCKLKSGCYVPLWNFNVIRDRARHAGAERIICKVIGYLQLPNKLETIPTNLFNIATTDRAGTGSTVSIRRAWKAT